MRASQRNIHPIIRQVIDRDCHVGESGSAVVRHVIGKLKHGYETFRALTERERRVLIEQCLTQHRDNLKLYQEVMNGFPKTRRAQASALREIKELDQAEISRLLLEHDCSVQFLGFRLGKTEVLVRRQMAQGIRSKPEIWRWLDAIAEAETELPISSQIRSEQEKVECGFCGLSLPEGERAYLYRQLAFCSKACCRYHRGW